MRLGELMNLFDSIEAALKDAEKQMKQSPELKYKREQLRTVKRSITQLVKKGIPIPQTMEELRENLQQEILNFSSSNKEFEEIFQRVLGLAVLSGKLVHKSPRKQLALMAKEKRSKTISSEILGNALIKVLEDMGGQGWEKEIFLRMEQILQSKLSDDDKERPKGKTPAWQTKLRKVRKRLIKERILTPDSKRKTWTLAN